MGKRGAPLAPAGRKTFVGIVATVFALFGLIAVPTAPWASAAPSPLILSVRASPSQLSPYGGTVLVTSQEKNAKTCQLRLLSRQNFPVVYASNERPCGPTFSAHVTIGANPTPVKRSVAFALIARNDRRNFSDRFYVSLAPKSNLKITITSLPAASADKTYHAGLTASGGVGALRWYATGLPPGLQVDLSGRITGASRLAGNFKIAVTVIDSTGHRATKTFHLRVSAAATSAPPTTAPATTTTVPTSTTTVPSVTTTVPAATTPAEPSLSVAEQDENWSGYALTGGPFTLVKGTFTVPSPDTGTPAQDVVSEWVGIDGIDGTAGAEDLIQAGVIETMTPCEGAVTNPNGAYNPNDAYVCPWTMFIENGQNTPGPIPQLTVNKGDSVTVEIWHESGTDWAISITDNTTGQSWSADDQYYAGPGSTAEWIVEDPGIVNQPCGSTSNGNEGGQCPLAPYSPAVTFSDIGISPDVTSTSYELTLVQDGVALSTPSAYSDGSFNVSYTGAAASNGNEQVVKPLLKTLGTPITKTGHAGPAPGGRTASEP